ncbi:MAG: hypothetical protein GY832_20405 [Chloroflexi bacterium]|nr:hypothetical protein [Chloroflexota bacterium]
MSEQRTIDNIPTEEFEQIVDQFIEQAAAWDGALPVKVFFDAWTALSLASFQQDWDNAEDAVYDNWRELYNIPAQ